MGLTRPDHPRSRGEYIFHDGNLRPNLGSSPLSRGIRYECVTEPLIRGIIPALAGNTRSADPCLSVHRDHPRSRGEYALRNPRFVRNRGSSPLSRGILIQGQVPVFLRRIIPALAGNTLPPWNETIERSDHPRSRGEYRMIVTLFDYVSGSSPLSRGILLRARSSAMVMGIIPALAGNTPVSSTPAGSGPDHPRSRGEYERCVLDPHAVAGSSPLSRGILVVAVPREPDGGIIPALAGNTEWRE